jgi:Bacterial EndoU nuclease
MWTKRLGKFIATLLIAALGYAMSHFGVLKHDVSPVPVEVAQTESGLAHNVKAQIQDTYKMTDRRRTHILYGDGTGGGHRAGAGKPGKTEFPHGWDDDKILLVITRIANDQNLPMRPSGQRYFIKMGEEDGIQIRVVLNPETGDIITGYPVDKRGR